MPTIVLAGHVCIDRNQSENTTYTGWGSTVLFMADCMQRYWQLSPMVWTRYGNDFTAFTKNFLLYPEQPQEVLTLQYENITKGHHRQQLCHGQEYAAPPEIDDEMRDLLRIADIIVVAPLLANYGVSFVQEVLSLVPPTCLKVMTPQGYLRHIDTHDRVWHREFVEAPQLIPLFDLVIFSEHDYPEAFAVGDQWHQRGAAHVVVTQGSEGATVISNGKRTHIPTTPIAPEHIIDSVGCGDVFAAAVTFYLHQTSDIYEAVQKAHGVAGRKLFAVPQEKAVESKTIH